ncbi:MAG: hypoxanthine phosphoribosyltransferase [Euzebyaceae bacterium]|jgi:hypoxanthine phosphoribosyltransferase|nr:hypoxanthine phosphoribosyltransferase [Euzebyaceae bacterium]
MARVTCRDHRQRVRGFGVDRKHDDIEQVLIPAEAIQQRLRELSAEIDRDYAGRKVLLVGVLKGAFIVMADMARYLTVPLEFDFMAVSSYGSATQTSGVVRILKDLDIDIAGRDVLVVEDIVDSGLTLNYLLRNLRARQPASLEIMTLLSKPDQARVEIPIRYHGFAVPNVFVVGYGLDYAENYRNLPYVGTLREEVYRS